MLAVLSASQALSSEPNLAGVHQRLVDELTALTGATSVHLVVQSGESQDWYLPPCGDRSSLVTGPGVADAVPMSVVHHAERTHEPILVGDTARDERFAPDPYFSGTEGCSLIAVPTVGRSGLRAVLLLLNSSTDSAFSPAHLDTAELIARQLAISLDVTLRNAASRRIADEQAALRRLATLVARGPGPEAVFAAVAGEAGALLGADSTAVVRFESDGDVTVMGAYGIAYTRPGARGKAFAPTTTAAVQATGHAARFDRDPSTRQRSRDDDHQGPYSAVASPILVEGTVWGAIGVAARRHRLPADTEQRLTDFTELVATAVANAQTRAELMASRARIVATADQTRRKIERDLHDGAQQRLISLALHVRAAQETLPPGLAELHAQFDQIVADAAEAVEELRETARGIHPAALSDGGLRCALGMLARRSTVPVELAVHAQARFPDYVELSTYYIVAEALTNAVKHGHASAVSITVDTAPAGTRNALCIVVDDDGVGGADLAGGTGLVGLKDRVDALGGRMLLHSPRGSGTRLRVELPLPTEDINT